MTNINDLLLYKGGRTWHYASSMASTWMWAPALFVSSWLGYYYGIVGLLAFCVPNFLSMIIFGWLADISINKRKQDGFTFKEALKTSHPYQVYLHIFLGFVLLICSMMVQTIGMHLMLTTWFPTIPKLVSAVIVTGIALSIVWKTGLKSCIITDSWKYLVTAGIGLFLLSLVLFNPDTNITEVKFFDHNDLDYLIGFSITTALGLISAPCVDQTFWQRVYSVPKNKIKSIFTTASCLFIIVPISFGLIGLLLRTQTGFQAVDWQVSQAFTGFLGILLGTAVFATLLSTFDSDLCAIQSLSEKVLNFNGKYMILLSCLFVIVLFTSINITIPALFLFYGTMRTSTAIPTILVVLDKLDKVRLLISTVFAIIIGSGGYLVASYFNYPYLYIFTILAFVLPIFGFSYGKNSISVHS